MKGLLEDEAGVTAMVEMARNFLGADEVRFSELQNCEGLWSMPETSFLGF